MSAKISGKVWELNLDPTEKLVLLALADHADHEGNNVRPGNDLLVAKTGLSQQTISAKITKFIELGILEPTKDGRGRGVVREFSIEPERAERKQFFIEREERKLQAARTYRKPESYKQSVPNETESYKRGVPLETERYNLTEEKVQSGKEKVQSDAIAYKEENRHEPSIEPSEREARALSPVSDVSAIWQEVFGEPITIYAQETLTSAVSDFDAFRRTLEIWKMNGYSRRGLDKILDRYSQEAKNNQTKQSVTANHLRLIDQMPAGLDDFGKTRWLKEQLAKGVAA